MAISKSCYLIPSPCRKLYKREFRLKISLQAALTERRKSYRMKRNNFMSCLSIEEAKIKATGRQFLAEICNQANKMTRCN
jgi:hypothetical protein